MNKRLAVGGEPVQLGGDAVVDPHPDHHQAVALDHGIEVPAGAHEPGEVQGQRMLDRERSDAQQGGPHRDALLLRDFQQRLLAGG